MTAPGRSFSNRDVEELRQVPRLQVLHDLRGEQSPKRAVRDRPEVGQQIGDRRAQPLVAADVHHRLVEIDAARPHTMLREQAQELAAPAPDVEHVARAREQRNVFEQPCPHVLG